MTEENIESSGFRVVDRRAFTSEGTRVPDRPDKKEVEVSEPEARISPPPQAALPAEPETAAVSIRVSVHSLRKKLSETGMKIKAEPRVGYEIDAAAVQALRSMAQALDSDPSQAALWRQYREALRELTADDSSNSVDEALAALYTEVRDAPPS